MWGTGWKPFRREISGGNGSVLYLDGVMISRQELQFLDIELTASVGCVYYVLKL